MINQIKREEEKMEKHFYIFRHGETALNVQKRWQGSGMDYPLTEKGQTQARQLAQKLHDIELEIIFSSPLLRAKQTAQVLAQEKNIPIEIIDDLRECHYGVAEGQLISDLSQLYPQILQNWNNPDEQYKDISFPQGESKQAALERVLKVIKHLATTQYTNMALAIHGGTMAQLLNHYQIPYTTIPNCATFQLIFDGANFFGQGELF